MKILITGAAGYMGSQLTSHFLSQKYQIKAFDNMFYGAESLLFGANNNDLEIIKADIRNAQELKLAMKSADCVIHLAGIVGEPACNLNRAISHAINHDAAKLVIDTANDCKLQRFIFISTCSNYGVSKPNEMVDESSKLNPLSDYAKAKVAIEEYLLKSCTIPFTILRFGTLCGLSARMRFDLLINEMSRAIALNEEIEVYSPQAWRPYLQIKDAAAAIEKIILADEKLIDKNIFNIVGQNLKKSDLADIVLRHYPQTKIKITDKAPDLRDYKVSGEKFNNTFMHFSSDSIEKSLLEMTKAIQNGYFLDPKSSIHSAIPLKPFN